MDPLMIGAVTLILLTAFSFSPLGLGGGALFVPILHYIVGFDMHLAIVASLILVWSVALGSRAAHEHDGFTAKKRGKKGIPTAVVGAVIGALVAFMLIEHVSDLVIKAAAAGVLIWVIARAAEKLRMESNGEAEPPEIKVEGEVLRKYRVGCFAGGAASGMLGIGGGSVFVTIHRQFLGLDAHKAAGTSYIIESWMVPVGILTHLFINGTAGDLAAEVGDPLFLILPLVVIGTAWLGAHYAIVHLPIKLITIGFISAVSLSIVRYLLDIGMFIGNL